jgi:hypothetical protein
MLDTTNEETGAANILVISEDNTRAHIYEDVHAIKRGHGIGRRDEAGAPKAEYFDRDGRRLLAQIGSSGQLTDLVPAPGDPDPAYVLSRLHAVVTHLIESAETMPADHPPVPIHIVGLITVTDFTQAFELYNGGLGHSDGSSSTGSWLHMLAAHGEMPW